MPTTAAHAAQDLRRRHPPGTTPSRGPEWVRRGPSPAPLPRWGPAARTITPVCGPPPRAPRSRPVKPGAQPLGLGKGTTVSGKPIGAPRATGPDEARRTNTGPRGTPERHAAGHSQGTQTGAKQQRLPGAANPESAHNRQRTTAREQVPSNTSCPPDGRVRARQQTQPLPATETPPSGWTSARPEGTQPLPATNSRCPHGQVRAWRLASPCRLQNSRRPDGRVRAQRVPSPCRLRTAAVGMAQCAPRSKPPHTQHRTHNTQHPHTQHT